MGESCASKGDMYLYQTDIIQAINFLNSKYHVSASEVQFLSQHYQWKQSNGQCVTKYTPHKSNRTLNNSLYI